MPDAPLPHKPRRPRRRSGTRPRRTALALLGVVVLLVAGLASAYAQGTGPAGRHAAHGKRHAAHRHRAGHRRRRTCTRRVVVIRHHRRHVRVERRRCPRRHGKGRAPHGVRSPTSGPNAATPAPPAAGGTSGATWWHPPQHLTWYWQLTGNVPADIPADAYDIDGFGASAAQVAALHAQGKHVICYVDVGTAESFRPDFSSFAGGLLGASNGWPGERWLDIRQLGALQPLLTARFRMCQSKGFDAVEPDNIDAYSNDSGFPITAAQQLTFDEWVAGAVHGLGMAVLQKNDLDQAAQLQPYFDGALVEQCNQYSECGSARPYLDAGKPVLDAEYSGSTSFCAADNAAGIMGALYDQSLDGGTYTPCW